MYLGKSKVVEDKSENLIPTKAALYGLDVRFREVDNRLSNEQDERNALKRRCKGNGPGKEKSNRHSMPFARNLLKTQGRDKKPVLSHMIKSTRNPCTI
jgi:hypothetical protein